MSTARTDPLHSWIDVTIRQAIFDFASPMAKPEKTSAARSLPALLVFVVFLSACANIQSGGDVAQGRQALFKGDNQTALAHFHHAAQIDPNYVYGTELREGVLSFLGRTQYLTGQLPQARQTLENVLAQHPDDNVARLYLGLTLARQGDQQRSLREIEAGMKGIHGFLDYLNNNFANSFGQFWDPNRSIRKIIQGDLAMISSGNIDWQRLIGDGEQVGKRIEEEADRAKQDERRFLEQQSVGP